jgi:hypothetical protein
MNIPGWGDFLLQKTGIFFPDCFYGIAINGMVGKFIADKVCNALAVGKRRVCTEIDLLAFKFFCRLFLQHTATCQEYEQ